MTRIILFVAGLILGYVLHQPVACTLSHLPRHRDPAIVRWPDSYDAWLAQAFDGEPVRR